MILICRPIVKHFLVPFFSRYFTIWRFYSLGYLKSIVLSSCKSVVRFPFFITQLILNKPKGIQLKQYIFN